MWRHPVVRACAAAVDLVFLGLLVFPEKVGLPLTKLPLGAQFLVGVLVVVAPMLELLARVIPRGE
jgi:hypothetical protein